MAKCLHTNIVSRIHTTKAVWYLCNDCGSHVARIDGKMQAVTVKHKGGSDYDLIVKETEEKAPDANELVEEEEKPMPVRIVREPYTEIDGEDE